MCENAVSRSATKWPCLEASSLYAYTPACSNGQGCPAFQMLMALGLMTSVVTLLCGAFSAGRTGSSVGTPRATAKASNGDHTGPGKGRAPRLRTPFTHTGLSAWPNQPTPGSFMLSKPITCGMSLTRRATWAMAPNKCLCRYSWTLTPSMRNCGVTCSPAQNSVHITALAGMR